MGTLAENARKDVEQSEVLRKVVADQIKSAIENLDALRGPLESEDDGNEVPRLTRLQNAIDELEDAELTKEDAAKLRSATGL